MYIILPLFLPLFTAHAMIPPITNHFSSEIEYKNEIKKRIHNNKIIMNECLESQKNGRQCPIGGMASVTEEQMRLVEGEL